MVHLISITPLILTKVSSLCIHQMSKNLLFYILYLVLFFLPIIADLSPLSNMPYLLELDASHNQIHKLLDFTPPKNLKVVDLSFNQIIAMSDLSAHHYLMKLNLDSILYNPFKPSNAEANLV